MEKPYPEEQEQSAENAVEIADKPDGGAEHTKEYDIVDAIDLPEDAVKPPRLTPKQRKIAEWAVGIAAALLIFALMYFLSSSEDGLLRNAFLIVFAAAMFVPRYFERKYKTQFKTYRFSLLIGCVIAFAVFLLLTLVIFPNPEGFFSPA